MLIASVCRMHVSIRAQHPEETTAVREVIIAAFGRAEVAELSEALTATAQGQSYVAEADGQLVGHVQLSRSWVDAARELVPVQVLSPLSVLPACQGNGIGGSLVRHALAEASLMGAPALFLEGDPRYYGRFGFARGVDHGFGKPSVRIPEAAFQVVPLPAREPWMTGALVYAEAFWALDCVGLRDDSVA